MHMNTKFVCHMWEGHMLLVCQHNAMIHGPLTEIGLFIMESSSCWLPLAVLGEV